MLQQLFILLLGLLSQFTPLELEGSTLFYSSEKERAELVVLGKADDVAGVGRNADEVVELTKSFKSRLNSRINSSNGFKLTHTDDEIKTLIEKGQSLGLSEKAIDDFLFISCREAKVIDASELAKQMDHWVNVIRKRGYPELFNSASDFNKFKTGVKKLLDDFGIPTKDIKVQGSALRTPNAKDVDIAVHLSKSEVDEIKQVLIERAKKTYGTSNQQQIKAFNDYVNLVEKQISKGYIKNRQFGKHPVTDKSIMEMIYGDGYYPTGQGLDLSIIIKEPVSYTHLTLPTTSRV